MSFIPDPTKPAEEVILSHKRTEYFDLMELSIISKTSKYQENMNQIPGLKSQIVSNEHLPNRKTHKYTK